MKFIDTAGIHVKAGDGGVGCVSFRREKFVPKGGPDGGDGGRGGDIVFRASRHLTTLLDFSYKRSYAAPRGEHGLGARKTGKSGESVLLRVPVGTIVRDEPSGKILADFVEDGEEVVIARGGRGGRGNAAFATSTNQAPREYERGSPGEERDLVLELKLIADVGLVGFPNAGKSTLISVISAARPKIADYPFTTLVPNLGIVRMGEGEHFVVADIPGLIRGAHEGKGLGHQFLRHIERTRVLVFLIESTSESPGEQYEVLLNELREYDRLLLGKPRLIALTKTDLLPGSKMKRVPSFGRTAGRGVPVMQISAVKQAGIDLLLKKVWSLVREEQKKIAKTERVLES
jgi:GTP-binding protein